MQIQSSLFILFSVVIIGFLILDLGYFNRKAHRVSANSAFLQTIFWIVLALLFALIIFFYMDKILALEFLSAYVTEKMLSVDNLFIMLLIFNFFKLDEKYHHRILFWGILGAIVFRAIFILAGAIIVSKFHFVLYIFGAILLYTGLQLLFEKREKHVNFEHNKVFRLAKRFLPFSTTSEHQGKFFVKENGKTVFTVLFMTLLMIEATDIVFAIDSIPAAFSISQSPFILFTSNIFAIMGLRSLFFLIENVLHRFHHLQRGLSFILIFVGAKMLLDIFDVHISSIASFTTIMIVLALSLVSSLIFPKKI
ncbi:MAG: TerC/Alx family metal homeostasis membrane protein [Candidatus Paceibacterota bacterium]